MNRKRWTARQLARRMVASWWLIERPTLLLRFRADLLPTLPSCVGHVFRPWQLAAVWPEDVVTVLCGLERGVKYVDVYPSEDGRHVFVQLLAYKDGTHRRPLPRVVDAIHHLQARGIRVEVL